MGSYLEYVSVVWERESEMMIDLQLEASQVLYFTYMVTE
jgi:hypothetical protein